MKKYLPLIILPPLVVILDQWTKWIINSKLAIGAQITVWTGYFDIVHIRNQGAAFGMLSGWNSEVREFFFYGISILALIILLTIYIRSQPKERRIQIPLAIILGGAMGNLIDRLSHGEVIDFLRFHWHNQTAQFTLLGKTYRILLVWPSFNVADIAITCGAIYLAIVILFFDSKKSKKVGSNL